MSGMEPILIGAAIGGGVSAATGGNPLLGAAIGAAGGGLGAAAGGAGGAAAGGAGGAAGGATGGATGGAFGTTAGAAASPLMSGTTGALSGYALPGSAAAITAPVTATAAPITTSSLGIGAGTGLGPTLEAAKTGVLQGAVAGDGVSTFEKLGKLAPFAGQLMGGGQQQQPQMSAPAIRRGQAPQVVAPIDELMRMQMMAQRQRRPISLL